VSDIAERDTASLTGTPGASTGRKAQARGWGSRAQLAVWPAIIALIVIGGFVSPAFWTQRNFINVLQQASVLAVLTLAMLLVVLVRKFDLSIESTVAFAPMLAAHIILPPPVGMGGALPGWSGFLIALAIGALIGVINGILVVKLQINAFIATLGMLILLRGATLGISNGETVVSPPMGMVWPGAAMIGSIPVSIILGALLYLGAWFFLRYHQVGRNLYAIGGNPVAARAAGINVERTVFGVFIVAGLLAAFAGLMLSGRIDSIVASQGSGTVFDVFAALAIGAVSLNGGKGTVAGALSGVLFLALLANILILAGLSSFWVDMARGAIIVVALVLSRITGGPARD
jgi:simple sugar transport system permease protein